MIHFTFPYCMFHSLNKLVRLKSGKYYCAIPFTIHKIILFPSSKKFKKGNLKGFTQKGINIHLHLHFIYEYICKTYCRKFL